MGSPTLALFFVPCNNLMERNFTFAGIASLIRRANKQYQPPKTSVAAIGGHRLRRTRCDSTLSERHLWAGDIPV